MSIRRKLKILGLGAATALGTLAAVGLPSASADQCKVTVKLVSGQTLTFTVTAPPGTPPANLVPPGTGPVASVHATCSSGSSSSTSTTTKTTPTPPTTTTTSKGSPKTKKHNSGTPTTHKHSSPTDSSKGPSHNASKKSSTKTKPKTSTKLKSKSKSSHPGTKPSNPGFSFSLPGGSPLGVPNFFIDSFRIPPFLLPIYQAAGIQYDVPWQILAAINEIETDYGRNLSVSSAGAVGWMQFMPSTWKKYGMDVTGTGYADPYNPVDAIFSAARYLHAAGASTNVPNAVYAYNHAWWYVQSVLLRAKLISGMPSELTGALSTLVEGYFPVAAPSKYADASVTKLASKHVTGSNAAVTVGSDPYSSGTNIFAKTGSPVIAVNDGRVIKIGYSQALGSYLQLQDNSGNVYTYANLGSIPKLYPVPKPLKVTKQQIVQQLTLPRTPKPTGPATAGAQRAAASLTTAKASKEATRAAVSLPVSTTPKAKPAPASAPVSSIPTPMPKERLFADPYRPASWAAGGALQIQNGSPSLSSFSNYFSDVLHLPKNQYTLQPLKVGARVIAGTILGRIGSRSGNLAPHVRFMIRPAGNNAPYIDPKPILDGWKLLAESKVYRAHGNNPFAGATKKATVGQILLMSKEQLTNRVLADSHVHIYSCGRRDIQGGLIDRRILAVIEFLSASKLDPTVSGLDCGHSQTKSTGVDAAGSTGASMDLSAINNVAILHHQGKGSITDTTIRSLLTLQGIYKPDAIVSLMSYKGQSATIAMPDHANRIQVSYTPYFGQNKKVSTELATLLRPGQWIQLINRINKIPEPVVSIAPSKYAIKIHP